MSRRLINEDLPVCTTLLKTCRSSSDCPIAFLVFSFVRLMPLPRRWESLRGPPGSMGLGLGPLLRMRLGRPAQRPGWLGTLVDEDLQAPGLGGSLLFRVLGPPRLILVAHRGREAISGCRAGIDGLVSGKRRSRTKVQKTREGKGKWRADVSS